jgi:cyclopropane fatty-acyl-phospholipid synthase-like methyltransferase
MKDTALPDRGLRRGLRFLNWLYNPFSRLDAPGVYDLLSTNAATERGLYLNLGYWREAQDLDQASEALALLVAETARMGGADRVLDCGFGFGDQDMLWAERYRPASIVGLNITGSQVEVARRRVAASGLDDRIELRHGSATEMPVEPDSVDVVIALECAFHFETRERFFREARRVLRPGGRLVTADIIPTPAVSEPRKRLEQRISWALVASRFAIPSDNADTRPTYFSKLSICGFEQVRVESIRDHVYGPLHRYLASRPEVLDRLHPLTGPPIRFALSFGPESVYRGLDYVLASAVKPREPLRLITG